MNDVKTPKTEAIIELTADELNIVAGGNRNGVSGGLGFDILTGGDDNDRLQDIIETRRSGWSFLDGPSID